MIELYRLDNNKVDYIQMIENVEITVIRSFQFTLVFQIQQRWSSYKSSSKYTTPEDYTDYEITKDPNEWKYVERVLRYKIVPKPTTGDTCIKLPSGYKPASGKGQLLNVFHSYIASLLQKYMYLSNTPLSNTIFFFPI